MRSFAEDGAGRLWIGTWGDGVDRLDGGRFRAFHKKDGLPSEIVRAMYRDRAGTLWIGTDDGGLVAVRGEAFTVYGPREGLSSPTVLAILEDRAGNLWIGTEGGGLDRFADGRFTATEPWTASPTTRCSRSTRTQTAASGSERTAAA